MSISDWIIASSGVITEVFTAVLALVAWISATRLEFREKMLETREQIKTGAEFLLQQSEGHLFKNGQPVFRAAKKATYQKV